MLRRKNGRRTSSTADDRMPEIPDTKIEWKRQEEIGKQMASRWDNYDLATLRKQVEQAGMEYRKSRGKAIEDKFAAIELVAELFVYAYVKRKLDELLGRYHDKEGIIVRKDAHPLNAIIRAMIVKSSGTAYAWAAAIRLALMKGAEIGKVGEYIKEHGGIDKCRRQFSRLMAKKLDRTGAIRRTRTVSRIAVKKVGVDAAAAAERTVVLRIDKKPVKVEDEFRKGYRKIRAKKEDLPVRIRARVSRKGRLTLQSMAIDKVRAAMARATLRGKGGNTHKV